MIDLFFYCQLTGIYPVISYSMQLSFYLSELMFRKKERYGKIFFKSLLLAVYSVFFTVQLFLRFTSPQSKQFLGPDHFQKALAAKSGVSKSLISKNIPDKNRSLSYLNKHYHPKDAVIVPLHDFQSQHYYLLISAKFDFINENIAIAKTNAAFLRGPPSFD